MWESVSRTERVASGQETSLEDILRSCFKSWHVRASVKKAFLKADPCFIDDCTELDNVFDVGGTRFLLAVQQALNVDLSLDKLARVDTFGDLRTLINQTLRNR